MQLVRDSVHILVFLQDLSGALPFDLLSFLDGFTVCLYFRRLCSRKISYSETKGGFNATVETSCLEIDTHQLKQSNAVIT